MPIKASKLSVTTIASRTETFVTVGKLDLKALVPTGVGLELVALTHPDDLVAGEPASFRLIVDGQFSFVWPAAGMYWMNAAIGSQRLRCQRGC